MKVRKTQSGRISLTSIDPMTLAFILKHAKESITRDNESVSVGVKMLNDDLILLCNKITEFIRQDALNVLTIDEVV